MTPACAPTMFVIDDDAGVLGAIRGGQCGMGFTRRWVEVSPGRKYLASRIWYRHPAI
jgi:hypothetical protein